MAAINFQLAIVGKCSPLMIGNLNISRVKRTEIKILWSINEFSQGPVHLNKARTGPRSAANFVAFWSFVRILFLSFIF